MQPDRNAPNAEAESPLITKLRSREAFAAYVRERFPGTSDFTVEQGIAIIAAFTGDSRPMVEATIQQVESFSGAGAWGVPSSLSLPRLLKLAEEVSDRLRQAKLWWCAPGVHLHDASDESSGEGNRGRNGLSQNAAGSGHHNQAARADPPLSPPSAAPPVGEHNRQVPPVQLAGYRVNLHVPLLGNVQTFTTYIRVLNMHLTRGSSSRVPVSSMEEAVENAMRDLGFAPDPTGSAWQTEQTERQTTPATAGTQTMDSVRTFEVPSRHRTPSPPPVPVPHAPGAALATPPPPSTTLGGLRGYVHRGGEVKECRQFVQTGVCSYGARCLFHHPESPTDNGATQRGHGDVTRREDEGRERERREGAHRQASPANTPVSLPQRRAPPSSSTLSASAPAPSTHGELVRGPGRPWGERPTFAQTFLANARMRWGDDFAPARETGERQVFSVQLSPRAAVQPTPPRREGRFFYVVDSAGRAYHFPFPPPLHYPPLGGPAG